MEEDFNICCGNWDEFGVCKCSRKLISIHGKMNSGKDTIAKIIQILTLFPKMDAKIIKENVIKNKSFSNNIFEVKKFADKLKDIVCILINCTREQLEDRDFKEKPLGEEWWYYKYLLHEAKINFTTGDFILDENGKAKRFPIINEKTCEQEWKFISKETIDGMSEELKLYHNVELVKLTPRLLLQLIGTECFRDIIHPNTWCNALFSDFKMSSKWVISDMRFPNEFESVKKRGGICISIQRDATTPSTHYSEKALDGDFKWDYVIDNNGSLEDLILKVKDILIKEGAI